MIPRARVYQVGPLRDIQPDDLCFRVWRNAVAHAMRLSENYDVAAIWSSRDEGGSLLGIIYDGEVFVRWE